MNLLSDFFNQILKRKTKYFLFFVQMIIIFITIQYTINIILDYNLFHQKLTEIDRDSSSMYYAFQDSTSEKIPDCTLDEYMNFRDSVNDICNNTAFSFNVSDIIINDNLIPDRFVYFNDGQNNYCQVTYLTENFLDYYNIRILNGRLFSEDEYNEISSEYIPVLAGYNYREYVSPGDILDNQYQVIGILQKNSSYLDTQLDTDLVYLDDQIVIPMIYLAEEWGGCYINQLVFHADSQEDIEGIQQLITDYGFEDYTIRKLSQQIDVLNQYFWTELSFMCLLAGTLFILCIFSTISMLLHLIEEQKTDFGIYMLCGCSRFGICVKISLPVLVLTILAVIPSFFMYHSLLNCILQLIFVLVTLLIILSLPLGYWLKQPISELKKERD